MIDPRAVQLFLDAPRDCHNWIKSASVKELDRAIAALNPVPRFRSPVRKHTKACFLLAVAYPQFFFMLCMGAGKTSLMLEVFQYLYDAEKVEKFLVLAPTEEVVVGWQEEIEKWGFDIPYAPLLGSTDLKWDKFLNQPTGMCGVTYLGLAHMVSDLVKVKDKKKDNKELKPNRETLDLLIGKVDGMVLDESTFVGSHQSLYYRICNAISKDVYWRYALAGRAFGRDPQLLWGQYKLIDGGQALGPTLGLFREAFFTKKKSYWGGPYSFDYKFDKAMEDELSRIITHRAIYYSPDDAELDLPALVPVIRRVNVPDSTRAYLDKARKELFAAKGDVSALELAFIRLRQLSSGFLGFKDDETGEKAHIIFPENPKLDLLMDLIEEMPPNAKGVIMYEFTPSGKMITERLKQAKIKHGWVWAGTKNYPELKKKYDHDPDFRFLVVNHKKGGYGLNLQAGNYIFFYESPVNCIDRDQAEKRVRRPGQMASRVFQYDLVVRGTMDEAILKWHAEGGSLFDALIDDPAAVFEETTNG